MLKEAAGILAAKAAAVAFFPGGGGGGTCILAVKLKVTDTPFMEYRSCNLDNKSERTEARKSVRIVFMPSGEPGNPPGILNSRCNGSCTSLSLENLCVQLDFIYLPRLMCRRVGRRRRRNLRIVALYKTHNHINYISYHINFGPEENLALYQRCQQIFSVACHANARPCIASGAPLDQ